MINTGDMVRVIDLWNKTERPPNQIEVPTMVLDTKPDECQSGLMVKVMCKSGPIFLDSDWFEK